MAVPGEPGPHEVVLRVGIAALCGTDVAQYLRATMIPVEASHPISAQQAPLTLGHELVSIVTARGTQVNDLTIGQRVVPGAAWWCGTCEQCRAGRTSICPQAYLYGLHANGGLAEYVRLPAKMCVPVPDGCTLEAAVLGQACAVALHALDRAGIVAGQTVALFGVSAMGSLLLAAWQADWQGILPCVAIDTDAARLMIAARLGVVHRINASHDNPLPALGTLTEGRGVDLAIEATGNPAAIVRAVASLKQGGRILQIGLPTRPVPFPLAALVQREQTLLTTNGQCCQTDLPRALALLATTEIAARIGVQVIALENVVRQGLRPLAARQTAAKILVRIAPPHVLAHASYTGVSLSIDAPEKGRP